MTIEEAIDCLLWTNPSPGGDFPDDVKEAIAFLTNAVNENKRLKAENKSLRHDLWTWNYWGRLLLDAAHKCQVAVPDESAIVQRKDG